MKIYKNLCKNTRKVRLIDDKIVLEPVIEYMIEPENETDRTLLVSIIDLAIEEGFTVYRSEFSASIVSKSKDALYTTSRPVIIIQAPVEKSGELDQFIINILKGVIKNACSETDTE